MKKILLLTITLLACLSIYPQVMFVADLTGSQETPPVTTNGKGTAFFILNSDTSSITMRITYAGLQGTYVSAHIHYGAVGDTGARAVPLIFNKNTFSTQWRNVPASFMAHLLNEDTYLDIHTSAFPNGEIRGQLRRVKGVGFTCSIFSSQVVPPVTSNAEGTAYAILTNNGTQIKFGISLAGFTSQVTGVNFCNGVFGTNGPAINNVTFTDSTVSGTWTGFADSIMTLLLRNKIYLNVSTAANPAGEIRGQFYRQGEIMFKISLTPEQEVPPVTSPAKATGWAVVSKNLATLYYNITYAKLSPHFTEAYMHHAPMGFEGPVMFALNFNNSHCNGSRTGLPDSLLRFAIKGELYVNIHSSINPYGEIRGQLLPMNGLGFTTELTPEQEVYPSVSPGIGSGWLEYGGSQGSEVDSARYQYTITTLTSAITAAHFYNAARLNQGSPIYPITWNDNTVSGSLAIADTMKLFEFFKNRMYVNVLTSNFPLGEIRGQVFFSGVQSGSVNDIKEEYIGAPAGFSLSQNYPNPFNPSTTIRYSVASSGLVKLRVYNLIGEQIAELVNKDIKAGEYEINWNAANLSSGIYFYRLETGNYSVVKKMILLK